MTFINGIRNLIRAEGYNLGEYEEDAKTMDGKERPILKRNIRTTTTVSFI